MHVRFLMEQDDLVNWLDYNAALIESHRRCLRDLFGPQKAPDLSLSRQERIGAWLVRVGQRVGNRCPPAAENLIVAESHQSQRSMLRV